MFPVSNERRIAMKRRALIIMLVLALVLTLPGCSKVESVEEAIAAIGTVTLDDAEAIANAEEQYNALSATEQGKVSNSAVLLAARKEFDRLAASVQYCIDTINAIGEVTLDSGDAIAAARTAWEDLRADDIADYASDAYPILKLAEETYDELRAQVLYAQAKELYKEAVELKIEEKYEAAWLVLDSIVVTYPNAPTTALARIDAADCLMILADKYYKSEQIHAAYNAVMRCEFYGIQNDTTKEMQELVFQRLAQIRPSNGKIFRSRSDHGLVRFRVISEGKDVCLKLTLTNNPESYLLFYVRAGEEFTVHMDEGEYILEYTYGDYWFSEEDMFGVTGHYRQIQGVAEGDVSRLDYVTVYDLFTIHIKDGEHEHALVITEDQF